MGTLILQYDFDEKPYEYEVEFSYASYLGEYLEERYSAVEEAVEDLREGNWLNASEEKEALQCQTLEGLADYIFDLDEDLAGSIVESDDDFVDSIEEELKKENEEDAYEEYQEEQNCDPDGFYGWGDYYRWKNG